MPFDAEAARIYGRVSAAVITTGRKPRRRIADFAGLDTLVRIIAVTRPAVPR